MIEVSTGMRARAVRRYTLGMPPTGGFRAEQTTADGWVVRGPDGDVLVAGLTEAEARAEVTRRTGASPAGRRDDLAAGDALDAITRTIAQAKGLSYEQAWRAVLADPACAALKHRYAARAR